MGDLLTVSLLETSALKFVPRIFYSEAQVNEIIARNQLASVEEETDTSLIVISAPTPEPTETPAPTESLMPGETPSLEVTPAPITPDSSAPSFEYQVPDGGLQENSYGFTLAPTDTPTPTPPPLDMTVEEE